MSAWCPKDCRCPPGTPRCAAGVRFTLDGCGCCRVCPRQLFEDCNKTLPCDRTKGLECNFGGRSGSAQGICRGELLSSPHVYHVVHSLCLFTRHIPNLASSSVSLKQPRQTEERASTATAFTRTGKSSVQTANTSALAWTVLLDVSPSARISSGCPNWAVPSPSGSRYGAGAVNNSQRQSAPPRRNTEKRRAETNCLETTSPTGMSWPPRGGVNPIISSEGSSVCLRPRLGPPAPNPAALEFPPGRPTETASANW